MNGPRRTVLGVTRSLTGRPWMSRLDDAGEAQALAISQLGGHGDLLSRVLAGRGVTPSTAEAYLDPSVRDLMPDPSVLADMDRAAARLADAVEAGAPVAIFGDYDVDGAASAALLAEYLRTCGTTAMIHIPDRIFEGYGPNPEAIRALAARGARLLVTVDCGTTSREPLAEADALGLQPIVLDHHQAPETLPNALVVNPNRLDDLSGLGQLCAAGVVFMTLVALQRIPARARLFRFTSRTRPARHARSRRPSHGGRRSTLDRPQPCLRQERAGSDAGTRPAGPASPARCGRSRWARHRVPFGLLGRATYQCRRTDW